MKNTLEHRVVAVRYIRVIERSTVAWSRIVKAFEGLGITAIPRYESKRVNDLELEHEIDVYASPEKIVGVVLALQKDANILFPWVTKIYIKLEKRV